MARAGAQSRQQPAMLARGTLEPHRRPAGFRWRRRARTPEALRREKSSRLSALPRKAPLPSFETVVENRGGPNGQRG